MELAIDQGPGSRTVHLNLPFFTLIGSTTNKERLTPNLLSCFRIIDHLDAYTIAELAALALRFSKSLGARD